ncbi:adenylate/guanylate cyclase catalytic domain protein [Ancylostoma caninum]|uniref:Adenylate/guanylate cyclase catalytic domain protein n=1 Tax=Ancylostoma caninum TaxID=29170 RepID=A0A368H9R1_ANCCA|nr:adenylate/guanylate cyclase catalytic domain protein [Ancylostoma caninum]
MLRIIDDYQENLESKICERTKHLEESLEKTENLLFHIMPRKVAEDLRQGIPICSAMHPSVSLMLTDVCKFTELCDSCIPVHIIDILQDLYSSFDEIVQRFQAFKVENVGDNYMIVSGLDEIPYHLAEVCKIAIEILEFVSKYEMKHRKDMKLQVKIGINCGAVASGILGSSAPRFCLFGDTVNMVCRMAALSEPGRIHITEGAANLIRNRYQVFTVEERGLVEVKGKGPTCTYWLTGCADSEIPSSSAS